MHEKKVRGMKRKTRTMIQRIEEHTKTFPSAFYYDEYWYMTWSRKTGTQIRLRN